MLPALVLALRLGLAATFAVAGTAKLLDRRGAIDAARSLGVPQQAARSVAIGLPLAELVVAGLLLVPATAAAGAAIAGAMLVAFSVAIVRVLRRGERPPCHCLGQLSAGPIGPGTLVRNAVLILAASAVAVVGWAEPGPGVADWLGGLDATAAWALGVTVLLLVVLILVLRFSFSLLRRHGRLVARIESIERALAAEGIALPDTPGVARPAAPGRLVDSPAPAFSLRRTGDSGQVSLSDLLSDGRHALLVFTDPACEPCRALTPEMHRWTLEGRGHLSVVSITARESEDATSGVLTLVDADARIRTAYGVEGTPGAVLVSPEARVASPLAVGADSIAELARAFFEPRRAVERLLDDLRPDRELMLLFWSTTCGHCQAMRDRLLEWESMSGPEHPALVLVTGGDPADVRAEGFVSEVVHDDGALAGAFGVRGTPTALVIEPGGFQPMPLAIGAEEIMTLAGRPSMVASPALSAEAAVPSPGPSSDPPERPHGSATGPDR